MNMMIESGRQKGVALALSLLLLLIMTLIGVAAMGSTIMQERMAGNARIQAMVFEAASSGVSSAIDFVQNEANWSGVPEPKTCGIVGAGKGWGPTAWTEVGQEGPIVIEQRMYCLEHPTDPADLPSQLFVLSRGSMVMDNGATAMREIEVRVDRHRNQIPTCAICPIGTVNEFSAANSKDLKVDGGCGPAITASTAADASKVINGIRENRIGNYIGGITHGDIGSPFNDPELTEEFVELAGNVVKEVMANGGPFEPITAEQVKNGEYTFDSGNHGWNWFEGNFTSSNNAEIGGNTRFGIRGNPDDPNDFGVPAITYFDGNLEAGGNVNGAGILIVNGNLTWHGTPGFDGLILVLGGGLTISGGGQGANPGGGSAVFANLQKPANNPIFGGVRFNWSGGGAQLFRYSCDALMAARAMLGMFSTQAADLWELECDCGDLNPNVNEFIIASWRENIGWRDEFFGSDET